MDDGAETSPRDDTSREGLHLRDRRSGRNLCGWCRGTAPGRTRERQQQVDRHRCCRSTWPRLRPHPAWRGRGSPAASLVLFVEASVAPGSTSLVDGWQGDAPLRKTYDYRPATVGDAKNASKLFPRVHRTFSNLKTGSRACTTASAQSTCRTTSMSSCFGSFAAARQWPLRGRRERSKTSVRQPSTSIFRTRLRPAAR